MQSSDLMLCIVPYYIQLQAATLTWLENDDPRHVVPYQKGRLAYLLVSKLVKKRHSLKSLLASVVDRSSQVKPFLNKSTAL